jgi:hypothetical protein
MSTAVAITVAPPPAAANTPNRSTMARRGDCLHPLWGEPGGLLCILSAGHPPGHVYHDPTGSHVDDRHRDGGHG